MGLGSGMSRRNGGRQNRVGRCRGRTLHAKVSGGLEEASEAVEKTHW
jgi:hypothetical protein